ncbi:multidrug efflux system membrane fusion protein [Azospirillum lipoferum]|uniref:efflux RND transporter periplasmic adaptor subunit n=1 Tax=Azospirillum TaxID=191 RepID=UPI001478DBA8|nr:MULTISPECIES: efflux RND transporter periplasmic adaptor subunit [Azospirillum]MCP1613945.1 multidrug efflux system membrane fusion protein [Azospirillum lipoferum]MDW5537661.1 efflux RND transporter periplasmic adaptor subunit [Azospirillum sp. NL1]
MRSLTVAGVLAGVVFAGSLWGQSADRPAKAAAPSQQQPVPVTVAPVTRQDVPLWLQGIGTVQAVSTVTIRSRVDGELQNAFFTEGQTIKAGDPLVQIDPRPFQATLDQATAKKAQDEAQLANAQRDLTRYEALAQRDFSSRQQADTQKAEVAQLQAQIKGDQALIDNAQVQLGYTLIRSPIGGRAGFGLVDPGNIVHATDANGILVVTQTDPITVVFTLPEDRLHDIVEAMARGTVAVSINSRDNQRHLKDGVLKVIDNQVDPATGTIRMKALFPNADNALWPGEFVAAEVLLHTDHGALTVPSAAVQRGASGLYVYVVAAPDERVELRTVKAARLGPQIAVITDGLKEGERVVVSGQLKVQPGARVDARPADQPLLVGQSVAQGGPAR